MIITFIVTIPVSIILLTLVNASVVLLIGTVATDNFDPAFISLLILAFAAEILVYDLASVIGQGAVTQAVSQVYIGQRPEWLPCIKVAWNRKWSLLGASLLVHGSLLVAIFLLVLVYFGLFSLVLLHYNTFTIILFMLCIVAGIPFSLLCLYVYAGVILASPAIVAEGFGNPIKGLNRSWELANGSRCYLVITNFCLWILKLLVHFLLRKMFMPEMDYVMNSGFTLVAAVLRLVAISLSFPLHAIIETVLYLNLRIGRESMNHQVLSGDLMKDAQPASQFRNDDPAATNEFMDYRHIPLMDDDDEKAMVLNISVDKAMVPNTSVV